MNTCEICGAAGWWGWLWCARPYTECFASHVICHACRRNAWVAPRAPSDRPRCPDLLTEAQRVVIALARTEAQDAR